VADSFADRLRTRKGVALISLAVAVVAVVVYLPTLSYEFVWDDNSLIVNNTVLAHSGIKDIFSRDFWAGTRAEQEPAAVLPYYRPVTSLSFWLDQKIAGIKPWYFHLINVILGAGSAVLVVLVVWELLHSAVWAGIAGLLFATHPNHTEAIAYVSGRSDLLVTLFLGFAGFALLRSLRKRNWRWWLVIPLGYGLALLSKESAFLFPLLVVWTPFLIQGRMPRGFWLVLLTLFLIGAGYLGLRHQIFNQALPLPTDGAGVNFFNIANTFGLYIRMFFLPFEHRVKIPLGPWIFETYAAFNLCDVVCPGNTAGGNTPAFPGCALGLFLGNHFLVAGVQCLSNWSSSHRKVAFSSFIWTGGAGDFPWGAIAGCPARSKTGGWFWIGGACRAFCPELPLPATGVAQ